MTTTAWSSAFGLIASNRRPFLASFGFYALYYVLMLAPGLLSREVFNALSGHASFGLNIWTIFAFLAAVEIGRFGVLYIGAVLSYAFRYAAEGLLKANMMRALVTGPSLPLTARISGDAVSRFRDDVADLVAFSNIWIVLPQLLLAAIAFAIMCSLNAGVAVAAAIPVLATVVVAYLITQKIQLYRKVSREATASTTSFLRSAFSAIHTIRLAGAEPRVADEVSSLNDRRKAASIKELLFTYSLTFFNANVAALGTGLVLLMAAGAMRSGEFSVGDFALFANYLAMTATTPLLIGQALALERQSRVAIGRMRALMPDQPTASLVGSQPRTRPSVAPPRHSGRLETLEVENLNLLHPSSGRGVHGVDLTLRAGTVTVITGRMGSGKSTLLRAILGLLPRDSGEIRWNGEPVLDPAAFMTPPHAAFTPQAPKLFSESLRDNILMGWESTDAAIADAVQRAALDQDIQAMEEGLGTAVGSRGKTLSGGQIQRTAAARMFVRSADLLVFDDLTSALDVHTERQLWDGISADRARTCLAVAHSKAAFCAADQILVLEEGRVVATGDLASLLASDEAFRSIWRTFA